MTSPDVLSSRQDFTLFLSRFFIFLSFLFSQLCRHALSSLILFFCFFCSSSALSEGARDRVGRDRAGWRNREKKSKNRMVERVMGKGVKNRKQDSRQVMWVFSV